MIVPKIACLTALFQFVQCENILFLLPVISRSETHLFEPIAEALAARGHRITYISPIPLKSKDNVKNVVPTMFLNADNLLVTDSFLEERALWKFNKLQYMVAIGTKWSKLLPQKCHEVWNHEEFQDVILQNSTKEKFDLVFMNGAMNTCFYGAVEKLSAPFVSITSVAILHVLSQFGTGFRPPPSFVPTPFFDFTDDMTFGQRLINTVLIWVQDFVDTFGHKSATDIYRHYLSDQNIPNAYDIEKKVSIMFGNSHPLVTMPRPAMPNMIDLAGVHCRDPKPLPVDLEEFVSSAKDGFIFFSLGSLVIPERSTPEFRKIFLSAFAKLKQKVIWKWNPGNMTESLPHNVKLVKWAPQQDILGHKNLRLFMTHGGLSSVIESVFHGVPLLGFPVFADQDVNLIVAEKRGFARKMDILDLDEITLFSAIEHLIYNNSYGFEAKRVQKVFKDYPDDGPLSRAIYWAEYIMKHKHTLHLHSPAKKLGFFQYHSFDVIAFLIFSTATIAFVLYKITLTLLTVIFSSGGKRNVKSDIQKKNS